MSDDTSQDANNEVRAGRGSGIELIWPLMFLGIGAAMLLWPDAITPLPYACEPGAFQDDAFDCLIGGAWGKPDAIALCFIIAMLMLLSAVHRRLRADDSW